MSFKCQYCPRIYALEWTKKRHEKLCREKQEAIKKHPERYKGVKTR